MDNKTPIIVALIGLMGTVTVALIANWHSIFSPAPTDRSAVTPPAAGPPTAEPVAQSPRAAADGAMDRAPIAKPAVRQVAGPWADMDDDYRYVVSQNGGAIAYRASENGKDRGGGEGTIIGNVLHYTFRATGGPGSCTATLADDGGQIVGTCRRGSESFPVRLKREIALTDPKTLFSAHRP